MYDEILLVTESLTHFHCPFAMDTMNCPFYGNVSSPNVSYLPLLNVPLQLVMVSFTLSQLCGTVGGLGQLGDSFAGLPHVAVVSCWVRWGWLDSENHTQDSWNKWSLSSYSAPLHQDTYICPYGGHRVQEQKGRASPKTQALFKLQFRSHLLLSH